MNDIERRVERLEHLEAAKVDADAELEAWIEATAELPIDHPRHQPPAVIADFRRLAVMGRETGWSFTALGADDLRALVQLLRLAVEDRRASAD